jgi:phosphate-selective porin OprO and OprP
MKKIHKKSAAAFATGAVLASMALGTPAVAQTADPVLNALIKKGILTQAEAQQVLAEVETAKKDEEAKKAKDAKTSAWVLPAGKEAHLKLGGFIQGQAEFGAVDSWLGNFDDKKGAPTDRVRLRRARINITGDFLENFDFKLEGDFQQGDGLSSSRTAFSATDIYLNYNKFPEANIRFGQYKAPFGLEQLTSDSSLFTAERTLATTVLTPERQVGLQISGKPFARVFSNKDIIEYSLGVFNGNGRNINVNDNNDFMYVGRLTTTPVNTKLWDQPVKWKLGANGFYNRYAAGTRISQSGNLLLNNDGSLSAFTVGTTNDARVIGWGVDQSLSFGPFDLVAEYMENKVGGTGFSNGTTATGRRDFVANGYYVQGSYYLPCKEQNREQRINVWQLVCKWESFNPGQERYLPTTLKRVDDIQTITAGVNWYIKGDSLKFMLDYMHTWDELRQDNKGIGHGEFDGVIGRVQVMF